MCYYQQIILLIQNLQPVNDKTLFHTKKSNILLSMKWFSFEGAEIKEKDWYASL